MSVNCIDCRKMHETNKALEAVHRTQIAAKDAEIAKLREALDNEKVLHDMTGECLRDAEACIKDLTEELEGKK